MRKKVFFYLFIAAVFCVGVGVFIANMLTDNPPTVETGETTNSTMATTPEFEDDTIALETESEGLETDGSPETTEPDTATESTPEGTTADTIETIGHEPTVPAESEPPAPVATEPIIEGPGIVLPIIPFETDPPTPVATEPPIPVVTEPVVTTPSEPTHVVKQSADLSTGISWDGVSPIIYTYPDGTTGTEIRIGAVFESLPGVYITVTKFHMPSQKPNTNENTELCAHCGKTMGDGTGDTCLRYSLVATDMLCPNCADTIPKSTCHTCSK